MINLKGKKVLITGATGGIGGALVKKFLSLNAEVLGTGTNLKKLEKLKEDFSKIKTKKFDISSHSEIEKYDNGISAIPLVLFDIPLVCDQYQVPSPSP